jgi:hypothetical protein
MARTSGHGHGPGYQRGCDLSQRNSREDKRVLRARNRGIEPEPSALTVVEPVEPEPDQAPPPPLEREPGRVEAAVQRDLDALGICAPSEAIAMAALVLGRDLDDRRLATSHASMAKALGQLMASLRREAAPKRGRLAVVQQMSTRV